MFQFELNQHVFFLIALLRLLLLSQINVEFLLSNIGRDESRKPLASLSDLARVHAKDSGNFGRKSNGKGRFGAFRPKYS